MDYFDFSPYMHLVHKGLEQSTNMHTQIKFCNVMYPVGAGGNALLYILSNTLFSKSIASTSKVIGNNEYQCSTIDRYMDCWHSHDLLRAIDKISTEERISYNKLITITVNTIQELSNITVLANAKHALNGYDKLGIIRQMNQSHVEEYKLQEKFMEHMQKKMPYSSITLDYRKFFIEQDESEVTKFFEFLNYYENSSKIMDLIKEYSDRNTQLMIGNGLEENWQWN